ncbi:hypothetical protein KI387_006523 [Taxus chinensis]|uniref:BED-type domain-containing protein n=1 Tax=Taxus chinensis TaxID=29808 RepID=A0AA38LKY5_TAXCH|nr:hypothetical protein KI387_006523 [Taxus chinensis]
MILEKQEDASLCLELVKQEEEQVNEGHSSGESSPVRRRSSRRRSGSVSSGYNNPLDFGIPAPARGTPSYVNYRNDPSSSSTGRRPRQPITPGSGGDATEIKAMASNSASGGGQEGSQDYKNTLVPMKFDAASPLWRHVTVVKNIVGGGSRIWICHGCHTQYNSSYSRLKIHLTGFGVGIKKCPKLSNEEMAKYLREQEDADRQTKRNQSGTVCLQRRLSSRPPTPTYFTHPFIHTQAQIHADPLDTPLDENTSRKKSKGVLEKPFNNEKRDIADEYVARCIYACGLPFHVLRSPYWQQMLTAINEAPQGYKGPSYENVRTTLLTTELEHIQTSLQPIRDLWKNSGVSIISEGWKNVQNRHLINVVAVCPKGAMFLKAIDCEGEVKDAQFIANILIEAIESVGPQNVVQVITDNAKICRAAGLIIEDKYEHIFWTPCVVHSLNLMLQKIENFLWVKQIYTETNDIKMFITNHNMSQAIFKRFSKLKLLKVAETKYASHMFVLRQLVKVKEDLRNMVIDNDWTKLRQVNTDKATKVKSLILDDEWWAKVVYLVNCTKPILSMIKYVDIDAPRMGEIYGRIDSMVERIKEIIQTKEQDLEETFYKEVKSVVMKMLNKMITPLHLFAYALNSRYYSSKILGLPNRQPPYNDSKVANGTRAAMKRFFPDPYVASVVRNEMGMFLTSKGSMGEVEAHFDKNTMSPGIWWCVHGHDAKYLRPMATKILSQVASNSFAERNWSTYPFIYSANRSKLTSKKAEDLVYVHSNLRLLTHKSEDYIRGLDKFWDILPETTDLDASAATFVQLPIFDGEDDIQGSSQGVESGAVESGASGSGM